MPDLEIQHTYKYKIHTKLRLIHEKVYFKIHSIFTCDHCTVLRKSPFWSFLIGNWPKIHKIGDFCYKKTSKFEENSKINIYSFVPKIVPPAALCIGGESKTPIYLAASCLQEAM